MQRRFRVGKASGLHKVGLRLVRGKLRLDQHVSLMLGYGKFKVSTRFNGLETKAGTLTYFIVCISIYIYTYTHTNHCLGFLERFVWFLHIFEKLS